MGRKKESQDVLDNFSNGNEVFGFLNRVKSAPNTPLRVVLLYRNYNKPFEVISDLLAEKGVTISCKLENKIHRLWELQIEDPQDTAPIECPHCKKEFQIDIDDVIEPKYYILEFLDSNLAMVVTNSKNNFDKLISAFNHVYPLVGRVFYKAEELRYLFNKVSELNSVEVIGKECVVKRLFEEKKTVSRYEQDTINGFFEKARRENSWVDSIEAQIEPLGTIRISRKGVILYSKPFNFAGLYQILIRTILNELLLKRRQLLSAKIRTDADPTVKPVVVRFDKDYFGEEDNVNKLVRRLNESDKYEITVLYLSPSLAHIEGYDYANGGGFDIFINKANELRIISQTQLTDVALEGIILKISDVFEGSIQ